MMDGSLAVLKSYQPSTNDLGRLTAYRAGRRRIRHSYACRALATAWRHAAKGELFRAASLVLQIARRTPLELVKCPLVVAYRRWIPTSVRKRTRRLLRPVRLGSLRRTTPVAGDFGYQRGGPVDRYYIERFLEEHQADISGRVLEVGERMYTERYGNDVEQSDVLDIDPNNPVATVIADLNDARQLAPNTYDCIILAQVLQLIFELDAAIETIERILRPGGVVLLTAPGISQIAPEMDWHWSFTQKSIERLVGHHFDERQVQTFGNVLAAVGLLHGLGAPEFSAEELDALDDAYPVIVAVRAVKK